MTLDSPRAAKALEAAGEDVAGCRQTTWQVGASRLSDPLISGKLEEVELTARAGIEAVSEEIEATLDLRPAPARPGTGSAAPAPVM